MSRINTNVPSLTARRVLNSQNGGLVSSLERLSTGLRINRGKDDPAGLIASENLRSEQRSLNAAIGNAERAEQVINVAEGGLQEINNLLLEVQSLVGSSANEAGVSPEEKEANQIAIDSIPANDRPPGELDELQRHQAAERQLRLHDFERFYERLGCEDRLCPDQ